MQDRLTGIPVLEPTLLSAQAERRDQERRLLGRLLWTLSLFGAFMTAVGVYGVISFLVSQRRKELGLRRAVGASAGAILRLIAASASGMVALGLLFGGLAAYGLSRVLQSRLFEVSALDPLSYLGATLTLAILATAACIAPTQAEFPLSRSASRPPDRRGSRATRA